MFAFIYMQHAVTYFLFFLLDQQVLNYKEMKTMLIIQDEKLFVEDFFYFFLVAVCSVEAHQRFLQKVLGIHCA